jgi:hypothetical protein
MDIINNIESPKGSFKSLFSDSYNLLHKQKNLHKKIGCR